MAGNGIFLPEIAKFPLFSKQKFKFFHENFAFFSRKFSQKFKFFFKFSKNKKFQIIKKNFKKVFTTLIDHLCL
jgi:hypothetical protein